jgi:hypothetical protein
MKDDVYLDGEHIPDDKIRAIFQWPPDVPRSFDRSSLLIGSRGVGKSTLFRYLKVTHHGVAIHSALAADLASFGKEAALGPFGTGYSDAVQRLVANKATSLLALSLSERFLGKGLRVTVDALADCLPSGKLSIPPRPTQEWCREARLACGPLALRDFESISSSRPLARLVSLVGERATFSGRSLLVLLDRADMVVPAALIPVIELLDQSAHYVALVAIRPGHGSSAFLAEEFGAVPGDHFGVVHFGRSPYEPAWQEFLSEALEAQLGKLSRTFVSKELAEHALVLARDSLRTALELFSACRSSPLKAADGMAEAIEMVRENNLVAAQRALQKYHPDYRRLVAEVRRELLGENHGATGPVHIEVLESKSAGLWERNTRVDGFIDAALRARALSMPSGQVWVPGARIREVEVPPILLWHKGDTYRSPRQAAILSVRRSEGALFESGGGRGQQNFSVFIAYRMDFEKSRAFRKDLGNILISMPSPPRVSAVDGHVRDGEDWAPVIRTRIRDSRLVVGDITGLRNDVIFEMGFGFGSRKPMIPVVEKQVDREGVPDWLKAKQIGSFSSPEQLASVATSVLAHLSDPYISKPRRVREPLPGLAVWLDFSDDLATARDAFVASCGREGLAAEVLKADLPDEVIIDQAVRAALLVAVVTGDQRDALVHFVAGGILARPTAGYSRKTMDRLILITSPVAGSARGLTADGLLRCAANVRTIEPQLLQSAISEYGKRHREWQKMAGRPSMDEK